MEMTESESYCEFILVGVYISERQFNRAVNKAHVNSLGEGLNWVNSLEGLDDVEADVVTADMDQMDRIEARVTYTSKMVRFATAFGFVAMKTSMENQETLGRVERKIAKLETGVRVVTVRQLRAIIPFS